MVLFLGCCGTFGFLPLKFESGGDPALLEERLALVTVGKHMDRAGPACFRVYLCLYRGSAENVVLRRNEQVRGV